MIVVRYTLVYAMHRRGASCAVIYGSIMRPSAVRFKSLPIHFEVDTRNAWQHVESLFHLPFAACSLATDDRQHGETLSLSSITFVNYSTGDRQLLLTIVVFTAAHL